MRITMENKALEMHKQWNGKLETVAKSKVKSQSLPQGTTIKKGQTISIHLN